MDEGSRRRTTYTHEPLYCHIAGVTSPASEDWVSRNRPLPLRSPPRPDDKGLQDLLSAVAERLIARGYL